VLYDDVLADALARDQFLEIFNSFGILIVQCSQERHFVSHFAGMFVALVQLFCRDKVYGQVGHQNVGDKLLRRVLLAPPHFLEVELNVSMMLFEATL